MTGKLIRFKAHTRYSVDYLLTCGNCSACFKVNAVFRKLAVAEIRKLGWRCLKDKGWVCPVCVKGTRKVMA